MRRSNSIIVTISNKILIDTFILNGSSLETNILLALCHLS